MQFNIIGAGRLGKNITLALTHANLGTPNMVYNRHLEQATEIVTQFEKGTAIQHLHDLTAADITFITTSDDAIPQITQQLAQLPSFPAGSIVIHCSGVLDSSVLNPLKEKGCYVASLHPLKAFRTENIDALAFQDCDCALEGDREATSVIVELFQKLGAVIFSIQREEKVAYHAAAVMASNYLVTLAASASRLFTQAGVDAQSSHAITLRLMQSSLHNLEQTNSASRALTGPLARGDVETIRKHLDVLSDPEVSALYRAAGKATLGLTGLNDEIIGELDFLLAT